jgi:hypothetical protein
MSDKTKFYTDQSLMHRRMQEQWARDAAKSATQPRCQCGLTYLEVPVMWQVPGKDRWSPGMYCCPACLPKELLIEVAIDVANLKSGEIEDEETPPPLADP